MSVPDVSNQLGTCPECESTNPAMCNYESDEGTPHPHHGGDGCCFHAFHGKPVEVPPAPEPLTFKERIENIDVDQYLEEPQGAAPQPASVREMAKKFYATTIELMPQDPGEARVFLAARMQALAVDAFMAGAGTGGGQRNEIIEACAEMCGEYVQWAAEKNDQVDGIIAKIATRLAANIRSLKLAATAPRTESQSTGPAYDHNTGADWAKKIGDAAQPDAGSLEQKARPESPGEEYDRLRYAADKFILESNGAYPQDTSDWTEGDWQDFLACFACSSFASEARPPKEK